MIILQSLILFIKGFIIGIGKVIPGVSGSLLAISLGVYKKAMDCVNSFFKQKKESLTFLIPLAIGVVLAVLLGSKIILHFITNYYVFTVVFFIGLIVGTVPSIVKENKMSSKDYFIILLIVTFFFFLNRFVYLEEFVPSNNLLSYIYIFFLGFLDAVTTILPGVSGTATYMMLGSYSFILELFASPFTQLFYCILFGSGLLIGLILMVKFVSFCFTKYEHLTWVVIIGFLFSSILSLFLDIIDYINQTNLFSLILLFLIGLQILSLLDKEE